MIPPIPNCELCQTPGGEIVWENALCRVVRVDQAGDDKLESGYPGFCRVIWRNHAREMTELSSFERQHLMLVVFAVETAIHRLYQPLKVNLASLGNVTPHLHWHVIPRYADDAHFPAPIWAAPLRPVSAAAARPEVTTQSLREAIARALIEEHCDGKG